jgi:hypothetical protein
MVAKQIQYEKTQALIADGDRALELIGRAIRMAGYVNPKMMSKSKTQVNTEYVIHLEKTKGYRGSDALTVRHGLSDGIDFDCVGNVITLDRTKQQMALQGFMVNPQAGVSQGSKINGGSLICQSLDRQGQLQNSMLMNGIHSMKIEELSAPNLSNPVAQRLYRIHLQMTDGNMIHINLERTFATRNLP